MIDRLMEVMNGLPWDKIEGNTLFIELDETTYQEFVKEVEEKSAAIAPNKENVADIGKSLKLSINGRNLIVVSNKEARGKLETIYVAFKTKVV